MAYELSQKELEAVTNVIRENVKKTETTPKQESNAYKAVKSYNETGVGAARLTNIQNRGETGTKKLDAQKQKEDQEEEKFDAARYKKDQAQKAYDEYVASDEYKQRLEEQERQQKQADIVKLFLPNTAPDLITPKVIRDEKEEQLRAARDQAEAEYNASEDQKVIEHDLETITGLSEEERRQLEAYAVGRVQDQNQTLELQGIAPTAQQEAAGLIQKYGRKRVDELAETYMRQQNAELARQVEEQARQQSNGFWGGLASSLATIPVNALGGVVGAAGQLQGAARSTGRYKTLDPNEVGTIGDTYSGAVRGQVQQNIEGEDPNFLRKAASIGYQGVMSAADSVARAYLGGGAFGGAALAATGSFSQTMAEASKRGATPAQAALLATTTAGIEALSEKIPLDNLIRTAKGGTQTVMEMVKTALVQAGIEATTEEISLLGTVLADAAIMQEKSEYQLSITSKIMQGMDPAQARDMADQELIDEAVNTALVSMASGGMSSLGGSAVAQYQQNRADAMANPAVNQPKKGDVIKSREALMQKYGQQEQATETQEAAQPQTEAQPVQKTDGELVQEAVAERVREVQRQKQAAETQTEQAPVEIQKETQQKKSTTKLHASEQPQQQQHISVQENLNQMQTERKKAENTYPTQETEKTNGKPIKDFYYHPIKIAPNTSFFGDQPMQGGKNIQFRLHDDNSVELKLEPFSGGKLFTPAALYGDFGALYDFVIDGKRISEDEALSNNGYYTFSDEVRPVVREINGGNFMPAQKGELHLYSDLRDPIDARNRKRELSEMATQAAPAESQYETQTETAQQQQQPENTVQEQPATVQQDSTQQTDTQMGASNQSTESGQPDYRNSNTYMNTGLRSENANIRAGYRQDLKSDPDAAKYAVKHNADSLAEAKRRVATPESANAALDDLLSRNNWTAEDVATSTLLLDQIMESGDRNAIAKLADLRQARKNVGVAAGQVSQSFSIQNETMRDAASPATAVDTFRSNLDRMKESETTYSKKSGVDFETWKENIKTEVDNIGIAIATVEDGDSASMREIIKQIAKARKTTAWFGTTDRVTNTAWNVLKKLEFDDLKKIANTQVAAMADDYRRRSFGEVVGTIRKQNMLSSLKTFNRNIGGNAAGGIADAVSESGAGQMVDFLLSKVTGKRTVGNDLFRGKTYLNAAKEAGQFASLCVELNIPIETDVDASFASAAGKSSNEKYVGKTFRATGNPAMRALYAYQKYMSYALEVTDKVFEGGANAAVTESLNRLQNANLTAEETQALGQFAANKRTFKNATWEQDGKTKGSLAARAGTKLKNDLGVLGEVASPFVNVPMNVAQTGIDYTAGVVKGIGEMIGIIKDAKAGKTIPVERQRQAASDFGRGVTGTAMIGLFASAAAMGALKATNDEDWDKEALAQAEGRSGAQINWDALLRGLNGESAEWKTTDTITSLDFLEPFNTQMYLGYEIANTEDMNALKYAGATIKSVWQSLMDSPVMTGLTDMVDTAKDLWEAETLEDAKNIGWGYAGELATSFIPQYVRQTAQEMDGYYRDTRGATPVESALNSVKAALPGLSQTLPKKYSGLGEVQERGSAAETFLDPTATKEYQKNEVTGYLDELTERTGDDSVYPERQAPTRFEVGGKEVQLDGQMRETYQKTYGEKNAQLYGGLIGHKDFEKLPDELKTEAFKAAEGYSEDYAKAAVSDYKNVPKGKTTAQLVQDIIADAVRAKINGSFSDIDTAREYGYSTEETSAGMDEMFNVYKNLSSSTKENIMEEATGDTKKYLEARSKGISNQQFLTVTERVKTLKTQPGYNEIRPAQEMEAVAKSSNLTESQKDVMMKLYMDDYDPNAKKPDTTELKYDYIREKGFSALEFADAYDIYSHEKNVGGDGTAKRTRERMCRELGIKMSEAKELYKLFGGYFKPWEE